MEFMSTKFLIQSSDPRLLEKATRIAKEFVQKYICDDIVGIVFLGQLPTDILILLLILILQYSKKKDRKFQSPKGFTKQKISKFRFICLTMKASSLILGIWQNVGHIPNHEFTLIHKKR